MSAPAAGRCDPLCTLAPRGRAPRVCGPSVRRRQRCAVAEDRSAADNRHNSSPTHPADPDEGERSCCTFYGCSSWAWLWAPSRASSCPCGALGDRPDGCPRHRRFIRRWLHRQALQQAAPGRSVSPRGNHPIGRRGFDRAVGLESTGALTAGRMRAPDTAGVLGPACTCDFSKSARP